MAVGTVPALTLVFQGLTVAVCILLPVICALVFKKKTGRNMNGVLVGALTFVISALVLESVFNNLVIKVTGTFITDNIWLYALYGGLAAGLFEETGRYIAMKKAMKQPLAKQDSVLYGIGHGGIEAVMVGAMGSVSNLAISVMINAGMAEKVFAEVPENMMDQVIEAYSPLWNESSFVFGLATVERIFAFVFHICLSYIVYRAVKDRKPVLYLLAVETHFTLDAGAVLLSKLVSSYVAEAFIVVFTVALAVAMLRLYKREPEPVELITTVVEEVAETVETAEVAKAAEPAETVVTVANETTEQTTEEGNSSEE